MSFLEALARFLAATAPAPAAAAIVDFGIDDELVEVAERRTKDDLASLGFEHTSSALFRGAGMDRERLMDAPGLCGESGSCAEEGAAAEEAAPIVALELPLTRWALAMLILLVVRAEADDDAEAAAPVLFSAPVAAGCSTLDTGQLLCAASAEDGAGRSRSPMESATWEPPRICAGSDSDSTSARPFQELPPVISAPSSSSSVFKSDRLGMTSSAHPAFIASSSCM
jgi:hypothetical protein